MPKIIMHLQEQIIMQAEKMLVQDGPEKISIRGVAKACGIAVGTIYNYYPTKDALIADLILHRWSRSKDDIYKSLDGVTDLFSGLDIIYEGISQFIVGNRNVWRATAVSKQFSHSYAEYHQKLSGEVSILVSYLLIRLPKEKDRIYVKFGQEGADAFISENILLCFSNKNINMSVLKAALS
ncbi:transcriptional regulator, TetR family [Butyrivibrio fibrisolvens DSM 3071]|uniref:Transcriptional regulator, TetR family n=1 Tax=Butyrivibrio fibrisolvens DSM 3071 TaxID=1121131 RepID=A0A1M5YNM1_BUTFI|nr:TetR/AcrR family transcriptional regulator [Butyrivibrio fibrisolvens]SHI13518.1 transcriptional regulator, TetR family [Butyrivibrio fibrisolvens DSM 3071]